MNTLLEKLKTLEIELHRPQVRINRERLLSLLHPDFSEVGRSGRSYTLASIVDRLVAANSQPIVFVDRFLVNELSPTVALLSYRSAHSSEQGDLINHTL